MSTIKTWRQLENYNYILLGTTETRTKLSSIAMIFLRSISR